MRNLSNFYINGKWVTPLSSASMPILNPATEEQIGTLPLGSELDVNRAVFAANSAFKSFGQSSKDDRLVSAKEN